MDIFRQRFLKNCLTQDFDILYKALIWQVVLYIKESATYCLSVPLFVHFSFSQTKIYVTDFSAPVEAPQSLQILYTLRGWPSILCKRNSRCLYLFCLLFQLFFFYHLSFLCNAYGHFPSKISQELLDLGFWNFVQSFDMTSCTVC